MRANSTRFISLQYLANRCLDVVELVKAADALALKNVNLLGLAKIAYYEQQGDEQGLLQAIVSFSQDLKKNAHSKLCMPNIRAFCADVQVYVDACFQPATAYSLFFKPTSSVFFAAKYTQPLSLLNTSAVRLPESYC